MKKTFTLISLLLLCTFSFASKKVIPGTPVLTTPADDEENYETPYFVWKVVTDTEGSGITYDFYLGTSPTNLPLLQDGLNENFANDDMVVVVEDDNFGLVLINPLPTKTKYYWKVVARNAAGESSASSVYSFSTSNPNINDPSRPDVPVPSSQATGIDRLPALSWKKSIDNDGDSVVYDLYLDTVTPPVRQVASDLTANRFQVTTALRGSTTYYWQLTAKDGRGRQSKGVVWDFTTANTPPSVPSLVSPAADEAGVAQRVTFQWQPASDADQDAVQYELWYGTTASPNISIATNATEADLDLAGETSYFWYVVAVDSRGARSASPTRKFTTRSTPGNHAPSAFTLLQPANAGNNVALPSVIRWNNATDSDGDAIAYTVYVSPTGTDFSAVSTVGGTTTFTLPGLTPATKYYWYVQASDGKGGVSQSAIWSFTTTADDVGITNIGGYFRYPHATDLYEFLNVPLTPAFAVDTLTYTIKGRTTVTDAVALAFYYKNAATTIRIDLPAGYTATKNITYILGLPTTAAQAIYQIEGPFDPGAIIPAVVHLKAGAMERIYTVNIRVNTLPQKPFLVTPADRQENVSVHPVFTWQSGDDTDGTVIIPRVYVGTSPTTMMPFTVPGNAKSYTYTGKALLNAVKYYWKVSVQDVQGETSESDVYSFVTEKNVAITAPVLTYPRVSTTYADTDFDLEWQYDPAKAATYDVFLDVQSTPARIAEGITDTRFALHSLANNTKYYWKIVAHHADGTSTESAVQNFRTKPVSGSATGSFVDARDGQRYQWVSLGGRKWMVHNLAYQPDAADGYTGYQYYFDAVSGNKEYFVVDNTPESLRKFGYLYNWIGALNGEDTKPTGQPRRGVCPNGWHLPTLGEWNDAYLAANGIAGDEAVGKNAIHFDTWPVAGKENQWLNTSGLSMLPSGSKLGTITTRSNLGQFWLAERDALGGGFYTRFEYNTVNKLLLVSESGADVASGGASVRCVKNTNEPPQKVTLSSPGDANTGVAFVPKLTWSASVDPDGDAVQYLVYADTEALPRKLVAEGLTTTSYDLTALAQNTTYYWKVVARDVNGLTTDSDVWSFTTTTSANKAPDVPQLLQPANGSTASTLTPTLTWATLNDTDGDVVKTEVYLGTAADDMTRVATSLTSTSYTLTSPVMSGGTYYWKVVAYDDKGGVTPSVVNTFVTGNRAPGAPVLLTPANTAQWTLLKHTFTWQKSADADGDPVTYTVYVGPTAATMVSVSTDQEEPYYQFSDFNNPVNTTYYWQVVASDGKGGKTASAVFSFKTYLSNDTNTALVLVSPSSGANQIDVNPVLTWNANAGRTYDVYLDDDNGQVPVARNLTTTTYTVAGLYGNTRLEPHTRYNWQVVSKTSTGIVSLSEKRGFTTRSSAPSKPELLLPANQATGQLYTPVLTWKASTDADNDRLFYDVLIGESSPPTTVVAANLLDPTYTVLPSVLKPNTVYYWKVIVRDAFGASAESDVRRFTTQINTQNSAPSTPQLSTPAQYAGNVNTLPALTWSPSSDIDGDAIRYDVYLSTQSTFGAATVSNISATTYTVSTPLAAHTTYYWKVIADDKKVNGRTSSSVWSFNTANNAPLAPALISPADQTVLSTATAVLTWGVVSDPDGDAIVYDVYLYKTSQSAIKVAQGLTTTSFTTSALDNNGAYSWKVVARDAYGAQAESEVFTLQGRNLPPAAAVLASPADNSKLSVANAVLAWLPAGDPDGDAVQYEIMFDEQPVPAKKVATLYANTSFSTPTLEVNHTYYWKIITRDTHGEASESAVWQFTYQPGSVNQPPTAPVLLTPADQGTGIAGSSVPLTWVGSTDPEGDPITYAVYASKDPAALQQQADNLTVTRFQLTSLNANETWYWQVTATDGQGNISTSQIWVFSTEVPVNGAPTVPILLTPANQSSGVTGSSVSLTWNASTDPEGDVVTYAVYAAKDPANLTQRVNNLTVTNFQLTGLSPNETWYWKVTATDAPGNVSTSETWAFSVAEQPTMYTISGTIYDEKHQRLGGVELVGFPVAVVTSAAGYYTTEVPEGWTGVVRPQAQNRTFSPEFRSYSNVAKNYSVDNYDAVLVNGIGENNRALLSVYPNPTAGSIRIAFEQKVVKAMWLVIVDARGQEVARQAVAQGSETVLWSGTDASGNLVNNGAYYAQLVEGNSVIAVAKLMVIK